jgi:4-hydroxy-3-polyprenylbenzoate decarboxylase
MKNLIFAITGASGGILAKRALEFLAGVEFTTHIVFSEAGEKVYGYETGGLKPNDDKAGENVYGYEKCGLKLNEPKAEDTDLAVNPQRGITNTTQNCGEAGFDNVLRRDLSRWVENGARFRVYNNADLFAPIASGSFPVDGMIIMPCSMSTAAKIATGIGDTLLCRTAACCIKEKTPFVIVPRESPLSAIHLQSLLTLSQNGVFIMPPVPAFYDRAVDFDTVITAIVGRVLKTAGVPNNLYTQWC